MDKRRYYSWILYDWANSAYATIVLAGFFPIIFSEYYASVVSDNTRTLILGVANSSASLLLIILAPILGLISDIKIELVAEAKICEMIEPPVQQA